MNQINSAADLVLACLVLATVPAAVGFPIWYHFRMRWRESAMGRHVMGYSVAVALTYLSGVVRWFYPQAAVGEFLRILISALLGAVVWWRVIIFMKIYHQTRKDRQVREDKDVSMGA
jgi:hypothetical protein